MIKITIVIKETEDSLEGSLDRVLLAAELEFPKILVPKLSQHTSDVNIECAGRGCLSIATTSSSCRILTLIPRDIYVTIGNPTFCLFLYLTGIFEASQPRLQRIFSL